MDQLSRIRTLFNSKAAILVCLFFVSVINIPGTGELILLIITLLSICFVIKHRVNPFSEPDLKVFSWLAIALIGSEVLPLLVNQPGPRTYGNIGSSVHFLLAPLIALYLQRNDWNREALWLGIKSGAVLTGLIAIAQTGRAHGAVNAIVFGDLAILLAFMSVLRLPVESGGQRVLSIAGAALGLVAVLLSQTRGAWLAAPVLFISLLYCWYCISGRVVNRKAFIAVTMIAISSAVIVVQSDQFQRRVDQVTEQMTAFEQGSQFTSVGLRMAIWQGAAEIWDEKILLGHGPANGSKAVSEHVSEEVKAKVASFSHLHNEYITVYIEQGVVGLIALFALLIVPAYLCLRRLHRRVNMELAGLGLVLIAGYSVFGLTNLAFGHGVMNSFFVLMLAIILPALTSPRRHTI